MRLETFDAFYNTSSSTSVSEVQLLQKIRLSRFVWKNSVIIRK